MNLWNIKIMSVKVERTIEAAPSEVFDAWLDPNCKGSPWNGETKSILQPVEDGFFLRTHPSHGGDYELAHYGRFTVLERPGRMQYTWVSQHTRGLESLVTITFEERNGATQVTLVHENIPDDEQGRMHEQGWDYCLAQVTEQLTHRGEAMTESEHALVRARDSA